MMNDEQLREQIINVFYKESPNSPWMTDKFYDKLLALITEQRREAYEDGFSKCLEKFYGPQ